MKKLPFHPPIVQKRIAMKKPLKKIGLCAIALMLCLAVIWVISVVSAWILTGLFANEFTNFDQLEYDFPHPWYEEPMIRVLSYTPNRATVYFCSETGGEKTEFVKHNGQWKFADTLAIWSDAGNAEDYFIWPYFKHYVP